MANITPPSLLFLRMAKPIGVPFRLAIVATVAIVVTITLPSGVAISLAIVANVEPGYTENPDTPAQNTKPQRGLVLVARGLNPA